MEPDPAYLEHDRDNQVTIPVADLGVGAYTATLRVSQDVASLDVLKETLRAVAMSTAPHLTVEVLFGANCPPPLLVTVDQAADCLGVDVGYVERLVEHGHLSVVGHHTRTRRWQKWPTRIVWSELVALVQQAVDRQELPDYPVEVEKAPPSRQPQVGDTAKVTRRVLREARKAGDDWFTVKQIFDMVDGRMRRHVPFETVRTGLYAAVRRGVVEKITYPADTPRGVGASYRWVEGARDFNRAGRPPKKKPLDSRSE